jgi:hypothetical protein
MFRTAGAVVGLMLSICAWAASAPEYGRFIGKVQTEWLDDGRRMRLLSRFSYVDPDERQWHAPAKWIVDGASIPQAGWSIIGGPFEGRYRAASVIHDVACVQKERPWEAVHQAFYYAMLASGVEVTTAKLMFAAVYHGGPRWDQVLVLPANADEIEEAVEWVKLQVDRTSVVKMLQVKPLAGTDRVQITVTVRAPPRRLSVADLERLQAEIQRREDTFNLAVAPKNTASAAQAANIGRGATARIAPPIAVESSVARPDTRKRQLDKRGNGRMKTSDESATTMDRPAIAAGGSTSNILEGGATAGHSTTAPPNSGAGGTAGVGSGSGGGGGMGEGSETSGSSSNSGSQSMRAPTWRIEGGMSLDEIKNFSSFLAPAP